MNNKKIFFLLLTSASLFLTSCKKELSGTSSLTKNMGKTMVVPLNFEYLNTKSRIRFQSEDTDISLTATIRIKKDSIIWLSLSPAFGIEAARGIITQDSLVILNRLNKEYKVFDFKELSEKFNFDINFGLIQAMLLGDMPIRQSLQDEIKIEGDHFIIHQEEGDVFVDNFINGLKMKPERVQLAEKSSTNTLTLLYGDFQPIKNATIPFSNKIALNYQDGKERHTTLIDIDHGKAEIADEPLSFPFNIPQKYDRK